MQYIFGFLMSLFALFLIPLVLIQRGRGGGLVGALGGAGGGSAFGARAGDTLTRVTMVSAGLWILLCVLAIRVLNNSADDPTLKLPPGAATMKSSASEGGGSEKK